LAGLEIKDAISKKGSKGGKREEHFYTSARTTRRSRKSGWGKVLERKIVESEEKGEERGKRDPNGIRFDVSG